MQISMRRNKEEEIGHAGRITEISPDCITVEIVSESACGACHAAGLCGASEMKDKRVEVPAFEAKGHAVGDEVEVALRASLGLKTVWISYMVPLLLLVGVVLALTAAGWKEVAAGGLAVAAVALYYVGLWLVRDRIARKYKFYLK